MPFALKLSTHLWRRIYKKLSGQGPIAANDLATAANTNPRLTREWLDQQASVGFVDYDPASDCYELSPEAAFALADECSPMFVAGALVAFRAMIIDTDKLITAFRGDGGIGWGDHHPDLFRGTKELFRPAYQNFLTQTWIPALDGILTKLQAGAAVAVVGCGQGISTIQMAKTYPKSTFAGFDLHQPSIAEAERVAQTAHLDNTSFAKAGVADFSGTFDLICFCDCLHDMGDPVGIAAHAKTRLASGGSVMLVEPFAHNTRSENHKGGLGGLLSRAGSADYSMVHLHSFAHRARCLSVWVARSGPRAANPVCERCSRKRGIRRFSAWPRRPLTSYTKPEPEVTCPRLVVARTAQRGLMFGGHLYLCVRISGHDLRS